MAAIWMKSSWVKSQEFLGSRPSQGPSQTPLLPPPLLRRPSACIRCFIYLLPSHIHAAATAAAPPPLLPPPAPPDPSADPPGRFAAIHALVPSSVVYSNGAENPENAADDETPENAPPLAPGGCWADWRRRRNASARACALRTRGHGHAVAPVARQRGFKLRFCFLSATDCRPASAASHAAACSG